MEENSKSLSNGLGVFGIPSLYVIRKTGEEVEVIDSHIQEFGARSPEDWVTYIDSKGGEHIKEPLNLSLDFKASKKLAKKFVSLFKPLPPLDIPDVWATRKYELVKELCLRDKTCRPKDAILMANYIISELKKEPEFRKKNK